MTIEGSNGHFVGGRASFHLNATAYDIDNLQYAQDQAVGGVRLKAGK